MIEVTGDIWEYEADALCITTNMVIKRDGTLVMGAGLALQAAKRFPRLPHEFGEHYRRFPYYKKDGDDFAFCYPISIGAGHPDIIAFPTKYDWRDNADLTLIYRSAVDLSVLTREMGYGKVVLPRPGTGLGNLDWDKVKTVIEPFLKSDTFHVITPK